MKSTHIFSLFVTLLACAAFHACSSGHDEDVLQETVLSCTPSSLNFAHEGGNLSFTLEANADWTVKMPVTAGGAAWCTLSLSSGKAGKHTIQVSAAANTGYDDRSVTLTVLAADKKQSIVVTQRRQGALILSQKEIEASPTGETIEVELSSNVDYRTEILPAGTDWITVAAETRGLTVSRLHYTVAANDTGKEREARIVFIDQTDSEVTDELVIRQAASTPYAAFLEQKNPCIMKGNTLLFNYDKATQQYYHAPARGIYRFLTDDGTRHIILTLSGTPDADTSLDGTVETNWDIDLASALRQVRLLQESEELVWLWSDEEATGFLFPKIQ